MDAEAQGQDDSDDDAHMGAAAAQHAMPPPHHPVQQQWAPPAGYFDPYFASMQESMSSQIAGLASQMQNQDEPQLSEHATADVPAHDGSDAGGSGEFILRHSSSGLML